MSYKDKLEKLAKAKTSKKAKKKVVGLFTAGLLAGKIIKHKPELKELEDLSEEEEYQRLKDKIKKEIM